MKYLRPSMLIMSVVMMPPTIASANSGPAILFQFSVHLTAVPTLIEQLQLFMGVTIRNVTVTS